MSRVESRSSRSSRYRSVRRERHTMRSWHEHWRGPGGGREVLSFSYPLILGQMTFTLQSFVNRLFLTWYAPEAVAAVTASVFVTQVGILVCAGTGQYTTTFIAQYMGA